jgi:hypothetical protein
MNSVIVGICGVLLIILLLTFLPSNKICSSQCSLQNLSFYKYDFGGYKNAVCLCKDNQGIIKMIYME